MNVLGGGTDRWRLGVAGVLSVVVVVTGRGLSGGKRGACRRDRGGGAEEEDGGLRRSEGGMVSAPGGGGLSVRLCSWTRNKPENKHLNKQLNSCDPYRDPMS